MRIGSGNNLDHAYGFLTCDIQLISEEDDGYVLEKYNFAEKFDVPPFLGMIKDLLFFRRGKLGKGSSGGEPLPKDRPRANKGCVNGEFKYKNKSSFNFNTWEIVEAFIPLKQYKKNDDNCCNFAQMTEWTSIKAISTGAGSTM